MKFTLGFLFILFPLILFSQEEVIGAGQLLKIEVSNIKIIDRQKTYFLLFIDLNNTGKEDIDLPFKTPIGNIEVVFEDTLKKSKYAYFEYLIKEKLSEEELYLPVGLVKNEYQVEIKLPKEIEPKKKKKALKKQEIIVKTPEIVVDSTKNIDTLQTKTKLDSTFSTKNIDTILIVKNQKDTSLVLEIIKKDTLIFRDSLIGKADLILDSIFILKKNKKHILVKVSVKNIGQKAVNLLGQTPNINDNLAIKSYFSTFPKKTNGAILINGFYLDKEASETENSILPNQNIWTEIEIPLKLKTKFSPYIVLEINALYNVEELTTDNNFIFIKIE